MIPFVIATTVGILADTPIPYLRIEDVVVARVNPQLSVKEGKGILLNSALIQIDVSPDASCVLIADPGDPGSKRQKAIPASLSLWDTRFGKRLARLENSLCGPSPVFAGQGKVVIGCEYFEDVKWLPDNPRRHTTRVSVWSVPELKILSSHVGRGYPRAVSPDGKLVVCERTVPKTMDGNRSRQVLELWDWKTDTVLLTLDPVGERTLSSVVCFSPAGDRIAVCGSRTSDDRYGVTLYDTKTGKRKGELFHGKTSIPGIPDEWKWRTSQIFGITIAPNGIDSYVTGGTGTSQWDFWKWNLVKEVPSHAPPPSDTSDQVTGRCYAQYLGDERLLVADYRQTAIISARTFTTQRTLRSDMFRQEYACRDKHLRVACSQDRSTAVILTDGYALDIWRLPR